MNVDALSWLEWNTNLREKNSPKNIYLWCHQLIWNTYLLPEASVAPVSASTRTEVYFPRTLNIKNWIFPLYVLYCIKFKYIKYFTPTSEKKHYLLYKSMLLAGFVRFLIMNMKCMKYKKYEISDVMNMKCVKCIKI